MTQRMSAAEQVQREADIELKAQRILWATNVPSATIRERATQHVAEPSAFYDSWLEGAACVRITAQFDAAEAANKPTGTAEEFVNGLAVRFARAALAR